MRLHNLLLHLTLGWVLFCAASLYAQQNGNLPTLIQGNGDGQLGIVGTGHLIVGAIAWDSSSACPLSGSVTDTSGLLTGIVTKSSICVTNGSNNQTFDPQLVMTPFYATTTGSGTWSPSLTTPGARLHYIMTGEYSQASNLSFDAQATPTGNTGVSNLSVSATTTATNDLLFPCFTSGPFLNGYPGGAPIPSGAQFTSAFPQTYSDLGGFCGFLHGGAIGTNSVTFNSGSTQTEGAEMTMLAFSCTNITVGTSKMPDGGVNTPYFAQLVGCGGTSTYTWSVTVGALPAGLSLAGATGKITGTPTASGATTFTVQISDGTHTGTRALTINIGTGLQTIFVRSSCTFAGVNVGPCAPSGVQTGDSVNIFYLGDDTHVSQGFIVASSNLSGPCGEPFVRAEPNVGEWRGTILEYTTTAACAWGSGTIAYNGNGGDPLAGVTVAFNGGQQIMDPIVVNESTPGNVTSTTLTSSFTTQVPNMLVLSLSALSSDGQSCASSTATNTPFNQIATANGGSATASEFAAYSESAPTTGSYSATSTFSACGGGNMTSIPAMQALVGIRPAMLSNAPSAGEKLRRRMN